MEKEISCYFVVSSFAAQSEKTLTTKSHEAAMIVSSTTARQKCLLLRTAILLAALGCVTQIYAQTTQCSLKLAELPVSAETFGFHLGMTGGQVQTRVPQIVFGHTDDVGVSKTTFNPGFDPRISKTAFVGVRTISLDFLDDRVSSLWLGYESSFKWQTVPDFVAEISQSLRLPDAWEPWKLRGRLIRCADFQITVSMVAGGASFHLIDETAEQAIAARRQAGDQEAAAAETEAEKEIIADKQARVYYSGECRPTTEVKETNRVTFKTKEEAEKAGYKAAKNCR
jgi:hypothetical protein